MRVLVVEDDRKVASFLDRGLREEGYAVDVAHDGTDGALKAQLYDYDLLLLDVMLPGTSGLEIVREVRAREKTVPILLLTARDSRDDIVRGLDTGADDYLVKPFGFDELLARIRALLRRGGAERPDRLLYADVELDRAKHEAHRKGSSSRPHAKGVPAPRVLSAPRRARGAQDRAAREGMGPELRPDEQRGGRARGASPP